MIVAFRRPDQVYKTSVVQPEPVAGNWQPTAAMRQVAKQFVEGFTTNDQLNGLRGAGLRGRGLAQSEAQNEVALAKAVAAHFSRGNTIALRVGDQVFTVSAHKPAPAGVIGRVVGMAKAMISGVPFDEKGPGPVLNNAQAAALRAAMGTNFVAYATARPFYVSSK